MLASLFELGLKRYYWTTTAYPPISDLWQPYKATPNSQFFSSINNYSLYIHIPFCQSKCAFCEYVTIPEPDEDIKERYVQSLIRELETYTSDIDMYSKTCIGLDIGGGTPLTLSEEQLEKLVKAIQRNCISIDNALSRSIETTSILAANDLNKLKVVKELGFNRLSFGVQTTDLCVANGLNLKVRSSDILRTAMHNSRQAGFEKTNIDIMYGLPHQTQQSLESTLNNVISLGPEHITLYEMRYEYTLVKQAFSPGQRAVLFTMYDLAFQMLTFAGYHAPYGRNTFTKCDDMGLSSYLQARTIDFIPYLGLGAGAQTFGKDFISFNYGKNDNAIQSYLDHIQTIGFGVRDYYKLPKEELAAKAIMISFYLGHFNIDTLNERLNINIRDMYSAELAFLIKNNLIEIKGSFLSVTEKGFKNYHGIAALFYPKPARDFLRQI
jgi:oxygen-independent coproporphyrinogen III oxidase